MDQTVRLHFQRVDPILFAAWEQIPVWDVPAVRTDYFLALCREIISQQLSGKAAEPIFARFVTLLEHQVTPQRVLAVADDQVRQVGMSWSKVRFLKALAQAVEEGIFGAAGLQGLEDVDDETVIAQLTKVKGIGRWTAEMFLMFSLGREDIFSYGDLGLRRAIQRLYSFRKEPTPRQIAKLEKQWSPYRTYACRILWKSLELPPPIPLDRG